MASFLDTLFGGGAEKDAANANRALLSDYLNKGTSALDTGLANSTTALNSAKGTLSDLQNKYGAGTDLYLNALGVNGADAAKTAQQSFTTNPGNDAAITAGLDAINRRRAAGGMLDSGNADLDALTFAQNNQNQQYGSWLDRLGGLVSPETQAASGVAGVDTNLANLSQTDATNRIGLYGNYASGNIGANNYQAAGESAGAKNLLGGALSLAGLGLKASGIGGFGSALRA
ncbi:hypothetical protein BN961_02135 [Afipia felis]|uniref:Uncharacterized protein n=1 Tax=Afipia felis TaxID=1035 RepID=A0A090MR49_AFIFE|nr:hypothetical protein [Afipia felis]CEG08717.1 hypothetical protein BN961_02135 [Afipia felis]